MRIRLNQVVRAAKALQHQRRAEAAQRHNRPGEHKRVAPGALRVGQRTVARKALLAKLNLDILAIHADLEALPENLHLQLAQNRFVEIGQRLRNKKPANAIFASSSTTSAFEVWPF